MGIIGAFFALLDALALVAGLAEIPHSIWKIFNPDKSTEANKISDRERKTRQRIAKPSMRAKGKCHGQSDSLKGLVEELQTANWPHGIGVALRLEGLAGEAGEVVEPLHQIVLENKKSAKHTLIWLIIQIGEKTTERWKQCASTSLCPKCMVYCSDHKVRLPEFEVTFYGCRQCCQSREFLDVSDKRIVVVLDSKMKEKYVEQDETLWVNWLIHRAMVDFDEVQIIQATDEDVERFVVKVGNNIDHTQRRNYGKMGCEISLDCQLSLNTIRILEKMFGQVKKARFSRGVSTNG